MITTLTKAVRAVWHTLRFHNWWNAKTPVLLTIFFVASFAADLDPHSIVVRLAVVLVWLVAAAAFGHYVNDVFDLEDDLVAGKPNTTTSHSTVTKVAISTALAALALAPWLMLRANGWQIGLVAGHLLIFLLYSSDPVRLKERGWVGVLTDSLYAHILPGLVVVFAVPGLHTMEAGAPLLAAFVAWQGLSGVRNILNHQFEDHDNDVLSDTHTIATIKGAGWVRRFVKRALVLPEVVVFYTVAILLPKLGGVLVVGHVVYTIYVYLREVSFRIEEKRLGKLETGSYDFLSGVVLNEFYEKWMPLLTTVTLMAYDVRWAAALAALLVLFPSLPRRFQTDVKYVVFTLSRRTYWALIKFYYRTIMRIKHEVYWGVVRMWRRRRAVSDFAYYRVWLPVKFTLYYKLWGRVKHYIYWKILHADLEPDDERPGERSVDR